MKFIRFLILALILTSGQSAFLFAQLDSLIVEKYYISDDKDATDTIGGGLPAGSVSYRIFADLATGSRLLKMYGDANHPIIFTSTDFFFNNTDRGKSLAREIRSTRLKENTVALDSWLTLGMASDIHSGVLKSKDTNGSLIGGANNDGGSEQISGGLLVNNDPAAGIMLTVEDGLVPAQVVPVNWLAQISGVNISSTTDTSIFGNINKGKQFFSNDFILSNNGSSGATPDNHVLIAQLTTRGNLSFSINLVVEEKDGSGTKTVKYVAENPQNGEISNRFLTYPTPPPPPPKCGCRDSSYLEYSKNLECHIADSCKTPAIPGCADPLACNYNPGANLNVPGLCCYPGKCNDRDIQVVCPGIKENMPDFSLYPNPVNDILSIKIRNVNLKRARFTIYDSNGISVADEDLGIIDDTIHQVNVSCLPKGVYIIRLLIDDLALTNTFIR